mgnify:CR=1 FL=1
MEKISIVMPIHNEEKRIARTLEEYLKFFKKIKKEGILDFEIVAVLNACKDRTPEIVKEFRKTSPELLILEFKQGGKGFAVIEGFKDSLKRNNDLIGFVDADMATPPEAFYDLVTKIKNYDGIIASRWEKDSIIRTKQTLLRIITSRGFNFLVRSILLLPYRDTQCGAKLFKKKALMRVVGEIGTTKWAWDIDLLYRMKRKNYRIIEVPTIWEDKRGSKLNIIKVPFQMFSSIIRLRLIHSPFSFVVRAYNKLPEGIRIHNW